MSVAEVIGLTRDYMTCSDLLNMLSCILESFIWRKKKNQPTKTTQSKKKSIYESTKNIVAQYSSVICGVAF